MDTNVLKTFIAVCEYSGFSAAAKELGYTQSTVSSQIKQLEKELDVRLFDRYYHKINLTEKGVLVLQQARNILKAQAKMLDLLNSAESIEGEIRLSMSSSVCSRYFKNDFLRFHHQYPEIKVEITENGTEQMFDKLRKNETDLVFTLDRHIYDSDFRFQEPDGFPVIGTQGFHSVFFCSSWLVLLTQTHSEKFHLISMNSLQQDYQPLQ